jgi:hypothetical protein
MKIDESDVTLKTDGHARWFSPNQIVADQMNADFDYADMAEPLTRNDEYVPDRPLLFFHRVAELLGAEIDSVHPLRISKKGVY